ncbi:MAG: hypothetical protein ACPGXZ_04195 [Saprospiraceae bacterium]
MKKHFLIFLLSSIAISLSAQKINWGPELQQSRKNSIEIIAGEDERGIYVYTERAQLFVSTVPVIEHYDKKMILKYSTPLKQLAKRAIQIDNFWHFNNKLFIYYTQYSRKQKKQILYYQEIDKKTGKLLDKPQELVKLPSFYRNPVQYSASSDSSKAVIFHTPIVEVGLFQKTPRATFQLHVLDQSLKNIWNKDIKTPYDADLFDAEKVEVSKKGNAYILARIYNKSRREKRNGQANYFYKIIAYTNNGETLKEYDLALDGLYITDITFKVNNNGKLTCAGFYSERSATTVKGSFFFTINTATSKIEKKGFEPFKEGFLAQLMSKRRARKGRELYRYYLDDIILRSDGGAVLIGEQYYSTSNTFYSGVGMNRVPNTTYTYHYEDIIIININPDASIAWASSIPKNQSSSTKAFSSYAQATAKGKIYFIYNEKISRRSPVIIASVNTRGKVDVKELFKNKDEGIITRPELCRQTSKDEMIMYGERGKRYKFGKLVFD